MGESASVATPSVGGALNTSRDAAPTEMLKGVLVAPVRPAAVALSA